MTDQPKWTPGPWRVDADGDVIAPDGPVAGPFYPDNFDTWPTWEQRKADAHLIAAAPDLYAALEAIRDNEVVRAICPSPLWGKMADAMIKARGETK